MPRALAAVFLLLFTACSRDADSDDPQTSFWSSLTALCGRAFEGRLVQGNESDSAFAGRPLTMHVRECGDTVIRIPFVAGEDRSRTWVITRTAEGLRLKHDHRHEDGSEDAITQYGGDTRDTGTVATQEFHADAHTASLIPAAATNIWTVEVTPDEQFAYALRREGTDRRFRVEFDLTREVPPPAAAVGERRSVRWPGLPVIPREARYANCVIPRERSARGISTR